MRTRALALLALSRGLRGAAAAESAALVLVPGWPDDVPDGSKRITLIRHAEGWHNKDHREMDNYMADGLGQTETYWDARLTPEGEEQAHKLRDKMQWRQRMGLPQLVAVSPLTRAVQTASFAFAEFPPRTKPATPNALMQMYRPPFRATSLLRERVWTHTCDGRRERHVLEAEFPHVDFGEVSEGADEMWEHKEDTPAQDDSDACAARGAELLQWLWARPEADIAVVTHWMFLRHLVRPFGHAKLQANFTNAEARFVTLLREKPAKPGTRDEL